MRAYFGVVLVGSSATCTVILCFFVTGELTADRDVRRDTTTSNFVLRENDPPENPPEAYWPLAADCTPFTYVLEWYEYDMTLTKLVVAVKWH